MRDDSLSWYSFRWLLPRYSLISGLGPFTSDPHLPQPIPSQARPEGNLDNDSEKADPEGEQEGAPITNVDAPRSVSF